MTTRWAPLKHAGFTIVELLVVIVVIGILAAVTIVSYRGLSNRAIASSATSDLTTVKKHMEIAAAKGGGKYPNFIPDDVKASKDITLRLVQSKPYSGLSSVQNGVLFQEVCNQLVAEGYGNGTNLGGGSDQYISGCNVWSHTSVQINGWNSHVFPTPLSATSVRTWYDANVANEAWFPNKRQTYFNFADELSARFTNLGGTFPIADFYDNYASAYSYQTLPTPNAGYIPTEYCVEASHVTRTSLVWHVDQTGTVRDGVCS